MTMGDGNKGIMMILSPAKTLDLEPYDKDAYGSFPSPTNPCCDLEKTKEVTHAMKKRDKESLQKLLGISAKLADTAHQVILCCKCVFLFSI